MSNQKPRPVRVFTFEGFKRCNFTTNFIDKGVEAWYTTLTDGSYLVRIITLHKHEIITKSYRDTEAFEKDFCVESD